MLDRLLLGQPRNPCRALAELRGRGLNFDPSLRAQYTPANGWHADDVRQALPLEPPGPPTPGGSWETARAIARNYDFADPSIVDGVFDRTEPLEQRTMLLILHFHRLRIYVGVRVGDVYDEERTLGGRRGRVFGWNYRTLEGHVEQGEMRWEVWKFCETGEVIFRVASCSRPAPRGNLLVRIGFRLFGRRQQLRFLSLTASRMALLTEHALRATPPR
jgi:uncharacterized protein (UPF0548 family)